MFELMPHEYIDASELPTLKQDVLSGKRKSNQLYGVVATYKDMVKHAETGAAASDKAHYYAHPEQYAARFHEYVLPYTNVLVNGMYWDYRFPRLVTKEQVQSITTAFSTSNAELLESCGCRLKI